MSAKTTTKRRFEFVEGTSRKFWEIETLGSEVHIQFGRIGTAGQAVSKSFPDEAAAAKHADKTMQEKMAKGYIEKAV
jgi:DNA ligase 1